jgi:hypothetical protein
MADRLNLFEYFAVAIPDHAMTSFTDITEVDQDQYDAPPEGIDLTSITHEMPTFGFSTALTAASETYDNDKGIESLSFPSQFVDETSITKVNGDTYDDESLTMLSVPMS